MGVCHKLDYSGGNLSLEQLTPTQMGSSRTPTCRMKSNLNLSPLTLFKSQNKQRVKNPRDPKPNCLSGNPLNLQDLQNPLQT
ncbi:hypothetical protein H5410_003410 [Solanum commersonii]|uniref:Uncharacterized protein n=1 Tax=Solanum commersonii TaxID=4109 RepID=A0A9J6B4L6_SOLCO|nr:hypothetical protein H5410_003410 [Solanum commersonii]